MAFKCGFFNSINGDKKYNADEMMNPIKGIVSDGVVADDLYSDGLQVQAYEGLKIIVKKGYGKFHNKWCENDADMIIDVPTPHVTESRIDSVIIKIDLSNEVRNGFLEYRQGTTVAPELERNNSVMEYRLANITVAPNTTEITQADIEDTRPTSECGFVTNLLQNSDITATYSQWQEQFNEWFGNVKETLSTSTLIRSFSSRYVTTEQDEKTIPIGITNYNSVIDILQVYINGLLLVDGFDYTILNFDEIELTNGVDAGTQISFVVYKSMDGSEAESFVRDMEELFKRIKVAENSLNANELDIARLTSEVVELGKDLSEPIWSGASVLGSIYKAEPNKKLSECKNGWILCWCSINQSNNTASNADFNFTTIPKGMLSFLKKESISVNCNLIHSHEEDGTFKQAVKKVFIYDDKVTGFAGNSVGLNADFVLRAIIEY